MNKTIISIEVQDYGDKEATIIVRGERNNQIMFEEHFEYKDEKVHPLRLHFMKEEFMNMPFVGRKPLAIMSISKLLKDITERREFMINYDYRDREVLTNYRRTTFSEIRGIFRKQNKTEQEYRHSLYNSNNVPIPDKCIERLVQRVFRPSEEDLFEEQSLGL
jgi:hypothetical protein